MLQTLFGVFQYSKNTGSMAKKWSEIVVQWSFMRDIRFETEFTTTTTNFLLLSKALFQAY